MQLPSLRITAAVAGAGVLAGAVSAASSHQTWIDSEQASPRGPMIGVGYALPIAGLAAVVAGVFLHKKPMVAVGAGALVGATAGWAMYNKQTGHKVIALPWDPDFKSGRVIQTAFAETYNDHAKTSRPAGKPLPHEAGSWSFAVVSDTGSGTGDMARIAEDIDRAQPSFIVHGGDLVQTKGNESEWKEKWDPPQYFGNLMKDYDVYPVIGNHEMLGKGELDPFFTRFPELDGMHWYTHSQKGIDFFMLDSNMSLKPGSEQYQWLDKALGAAKGRAQVVVLHHPLLRGSASSGSSERWDQIGDLMQKHDVEMVLAAHQHGYERSKPLNRAGTVQVTTGSGGYGARPFMFDQPTWSAYRKPDMGHLEIEVQGDALVGRWLLEGGKLDDSWKIALDGE